MANEASPPALSPERSVEYVDHYGEKLKLTLNMVRNYLVTGNKDLVTDQELTFFMHQCRALKLNPFLRECWLIKYSANETAQIIESIHHIRTNAMKHPQCVGWQKGIIIQHKSGEIVRTSGLLPKDATLLGAWFNAKPKGWEIDFELEINLAGYVKTKRDGSITAFWQPHNQPSQIMKVVESQGLRTLFSETVGNVYIEEELPPIEMESGPSGKFQRSEEPAGPDPEKVAEFDRLASEQIDYPPDATLDKFLEITANSNRATVDSIKAEAAGVFKEFWAQFEKWLDLRTKKTTKAKEKAPATATIEKEITAEQLDAAAGTEKAPPQVQYPKVLGLEIQKLIDEGDNTMIDILQKRNMSNAPSSPSTQRAVWDQYMAKIANSAKGTDEGQF